MSHLFVPHFSLTKEIELPKEYKKKITSIDIEINKIIIILMFNKSKKKNQFYLIYSNSKKKSFNQRTKYIFGSITSTRLNGI